MPNLIKAFVELEITEIKTLEINYYFNKSENRIQFYRETFDDSSFSKYVGEEFFTNDESVLDKVYNYTISLSFAVNKLINEKLEKMNKLKTLLT